MSEEHSEITIADIANKEHARIDPSENPQEEYTLYSFSAHDNNKTPENVKGQDVGSKKYEVPDNCVLITKLNPRIPRVWKIDTANNGICSTEFVVIKPKDSEMLDYLYSILSSKAFFHDMEKITGGTSGSHQRVKQSDILSYKFKSPNDDKMKKKIGYINNNINKKIKLNHESIALLENTSHKIYENQIVNKSNKNVNLNDIAEFTNEYVFSQDEISKTGEPIIKIRELKKGVTNNTDYYPTNNDIDEIYYLEMGDILLSWSASLDVYRWENNYGILNQHIYKVTPKEPYTKEFVSQTLSYVLNEINSRASGTTMEHITQEDLYSIDVPIVDFKNIKKLSKIIEPMRNEINMIHKENSNLEELQDYLLPKLLSGELNINNIDID